MEDDNLSLIDKLKQRVSNSGWFTTILNPLKRRNSSHDESSNASNAAESSSKMTEHRKVSNPKILKTDQDHNIGSPACISKDYYTEGGSRITYIGTVKPTAPSTNLSVGSRNDSLVPSSPNRSFSLKYEKKNKDKRSSMSSHNDKRLLQLLTNMAKSNNSVSSTTYSSSQKRGAGDVEDNEVASSSFSESRPAKRVRFDISPQSEDEECDDHLTQKRKATFNGSSRFLTRTTQSDRSFKVKNVCQVQNDSFVFSKPLSVDPSNDEPPKNSKCVTEDSTNIPVKIPGLSGPATLINFSYGESILSPPTDNLEDNREMDDLKEQAVELEKKLLECGEDLSLSTLNDVLTKMDVIIDKARGLPSNDDCKMTLKWMESIVRECHLRIQLIGLKENKKDETENIGHSHLNAPKVAFKGWANQPSGDTISCPLCMINVAKTDKHCPACNTEIQPSGTVSNDQANHVGIPSDDKPAQIPKFTFPDSSFTPTLTSDPLNKFTTPFLPSITTQMGVPSFTAPCDFPTLSNPSLNLLPVCSPLSTSIGISYEPLSTSLSTELPRPAQSFISGAFQMSTPFSSAETFPSKTTPFSFTAPQVSTASTSVGFPPYPTVTCQNTSLPPASPNISNTYGSTQSIHNIQVNPPRSDELSTTVFGENFVKPDPKKITSNLIPSEFGSINNPVGFPSPLPSTQINQTPFAKTNSSDRPFTFGDSQMPSSSINVGTFPIVSFPSYSQSDSFLKPVNILPNLSDSMFPAIGVTQTATCSQGNPPMFGSSLYSPIPNIPSLSDNPSTLAQTPAYNQGKPPMFGSKLYSPMPSISSFGDNPSTLTQTGTSNQGNQPMFGSSLYSPIPNIPSLSDNSTKRGLNTSTPFLFGPINTDKSTADGFSFGSSPKIGSTNTNLGFPMGTSPAFGLGNSNLFRSTSSEGNNSTTMFSAKPSITSDRPVLKAVRRFNR